MRSIFFLFVTVTLAVSCGEDYSNERHYPKDDYLQCLPWELLEVKYFRYRKYSKDSLIEINRYIRLDKDGHLDVYVDGESFCWHHWKGSIYCLLVEVHDYVVAINGLPADGLLDYIEGDVMSARGLLIFNTMRGKSFQLRFDHSKIPNFLAAAIQALEDKAIKGGGSREAIAVKPLEKQIRNIETK